MQSSVAAGETRPDGAAAHAGAGRAAPAVRRPRRAVHGVLLLDKPLGLSSNDALQKARRLLRAEKAGHTGTLDPLATGLLPLCFGAATKFSQTSLDADKRYLATLRLGLTTTTGDAEGEVLRSRPLPADGAALRRLVEAACARFVGRIAQLPPMHSALKHEGRALYDYARAGIEVARERREVTIHSITVVGNPAPRPAPLGGEGANPSPAALPWPAREAVASHADALSRGEGQGGGEDGIVRIDVRCSKGTYIRTLAEDIGEALGCGAHLAALRRTGSGPLRLDGAVTLEQLAALDEPARDALLLPVDHLLADRPVVRLDEAEAGRFLTGLRRRVDLPDAPLVRVTGPDPRAFLGSARVHAGELIAERLLSPPEVAALLAAPSS